MAKTCPYCSTTLTLPPTIATLIEKHPNIITSVLDRRIRRCRQCDLSAANKRAIEAECPPPNFTNPILEVERHINEVRGLIEKDTLRTDLLRILPEMHRRRAALIEERDRRIAAAWREYSGIWGPQDVPAGVLFRG